MERATVLERTLIEPEYSLWAEILAKNRILLAALPPEIRSIRNGLRASLSEERAVFNKLVEQMIAAVEPGTDVVFGPSPDQFDQELIVTGQQPVIYHWGLCFKQELCKKFAKSSGGQSVNIIIDTDCGDAGRLFYPARARAGKEIREISLSQDSGLYYGQLLKPGNDLNQLFCRLEADLVAADLSCSDLAIKQIGQLYQCLANKSIIIANLVLRRRFFDYSCDFDLPLSQLVQNPIAQQFFAIFLANPVKTFELYNQTLDHYRNQHRIGNKANPFPNLRVGSECLELPFWAIDLKQRTRAPLYGRPREEMIELLESGIKPIASFYRTDCARGPALLDKERLIAPRAMLTTMFLRILLADLFVHGSGGGKYDRCTNMFVKSFFSVECPDYVIATADRYLFPAQRDLLKTAEQRKQLLQQALHHPEICLGKGILNSQSELLLQQLQQKKLVLVGQLKSERQKGLSVRPINQEVKELEAQQRALITAELGGGQLEITQQERQVLSCREFPFFLFAPLS